MTQQEDDNMADEAIHEPEHEFGEAVFTKGPPPDCFISDPFPTTSQVIAEAQAALDGLPGVVLASVSISLAHLPPARLNAIVATIDTVLRAEIAFAKAHLQELREAQ